MKVLNVTSKRKMLANVVSQTHESCLKQTTF